MTALPEITDRADVQRLVAYGYDLGHSRHFVLTVAHAENARTFLDALVKSGMLADASIRGEGIVELARNGKCPVSVGFTFEGLAKLELAVPYQRVFEEKAKAFSKGAFRRAGRHLADTGPSAAERWEEHFLPHRAHVLLVIHAADEDGLKKCTIELEGLDRDKGLHGWRSWLDGHHLAGKYGGRTVHFGFRDGIATPGIKGFHDEKPGREMHEPGEFLLGYWNDNRFNPWLLVNPWQRPNWWLPPPASKQDPRLREFFRNGSFCAFRKIEQDEKALDDFAAHWAAHDKKFDAIYVKAKLAGRWPDGQVVLPGQVAWTPAGENQDAPTDEELNTFNFAEDPDGFGCPFGAHIRRMNPRADDVVPFRRRPLMRRGMPYGPSYADAPDEKRGLLGLFFCASLEDQFEFLLREWGNANPMGPPNKGTARDPFSAGSQHPDAVFDVPVPGEKQKKFDGLRPFLATRGTLYAFFPGLNAIRRIARRGAP